MYRLHLDCQKVTLNKLSFILFIFYRKCVFLKFKPGTPYQTMQGDCFFKNVYEKLL